MAYGARSYYPTDVPPNSTRARYEVRYQYLRTERSTWRDHWRDLSVNIRPRRFRWEPSDRYRSGTQMNGKILNNTATRASRILSSGMMAGVTSPARPWFRLKLDDDKVMERQDVRMWLAEVEERMRQVFAVSNLYSALPMLYGDMGDFGTAAMIVDEDDIDVIRCQVLPIGSYCLAQDHSYRVNAIYRESTRTAEQLVNWFGSENCSAQTNALFQNTPDAWVEVMQVIELNDDRIPERGDWKGMKWRSVWYEYSETEKILGFQGYNEFPAMCPRWSAVGEDVYGECPGMDALPDIKGLQHLERRRGQALDKIVNPPMVAPSSMKARRMSILAGDITVSGRNQGNQKFEPAHTVDSRIAFMENELGRVESRIEATYFADLFMMLTMSRSPQRTAREIEELHEEKMLQLGPVLENLHDELLEPLIDRTFAVMHRRGLLPDAPEAIQGQAMGVELISILAQAQKLVGTVAVERLNEFAMRLAEGGQPEALDVLDPDENVREYADLLGTKPSLVRTKEVVEARRAAREKAAEAQQAAEAMKTAGAGAASLASADLTNDNALTRMLGGA